MPEPQETFRSFTVRVPLSLYTKLADSARADGVFINQKANQLLRLGMGESVNLTDAIVRLLANQVEPIDDDPA